MDGAGTKYVGYCMKCRTKQPMVNAKLVKTNNRNRAQGKCQKCGTNMTVFLKKDKE
jgi:Domain of unknown function (DUF5679)